MASAFAHALVGASIALVFRAHLPQVQQLSRNGESRERLDELQAAQIKVSRQKLLILAPLWCALLAAAPDLDVVMHVFVRYEDAMGHRGVFHSPAFYLLVAIILAPRIGTPFRAPGRRTKPSERRADRGWTLWLGGLIFTALLSHSILDMLTTGGLGIAIFWPFSSERFFLPWQVVPVSPLSVGAFFGEWGQRVLLSEMKWAAPSVVIALLYERTVRHLRR